MNANNKDKLSHDDTSAKNERFLVYHYEESVEEFRNFTENESLNPESSRTASIGYSWIFTKNIPQ